MTTETMHAREGLIGQAIAATGRRLLPRDLTGGMTLTLPSGRQHRIGFQKPGIHCDLVLRNYRPVFSAMRRGAVGFGEGPAGRADRAVVHVLEEEVALAGPRFAAEEREEGFTVAGGRVAGHLEEGWQDIDEVERRRFDAAGSSNRRSEGDAAGGDSSAVLAKGARSSW